MEGKNIQNLMDELCCPMATWIAILKPYNAHIRV